MLEEKLRIKTVPLFGGITGTLRQDIDIDITNRETQSVQCKSVARTNVFDYGAATVFQ